MRTFTIQLSEDHFYILEKLGAGNAAGSAQSIIELHLDSLPFDKKPKRPVTFAAKKYHVYFTKDEGRRIRALKVDPNVLILKALQAFETRKTDVMTAGDLPQSQCGLLNEPAVFTFDIDHDVAVKHGLVGGDPQKAICTLRAALRNYLR